MHKNTQTTDYNDSEVTSHSQKIIELLPCGKYFANCGTVMMINSPLPCLTDCAVIQV